MVLQSKCNWFEHFADGQLTAVIAIILVSVLNLISRTMGTRFSVMITTVKIGSLVFVFVLGLISLLRNGPGPSLTPSTLFEGTSTNPGSYALALYSGLWAFDGWDQCNVSFPRDRPI
jgi:amino acid transporter